MATWHQRRSGIPLYHDTKYALVSDPPNDCAAVTLFDTRTEAEETLARRQANSPGENIHCYILDPHPYPAEKKRKR